MSNSETLITVSVPVPVSNRIHVCPVDTALSMMAGKWKPRILWKLHKYKTMRFGELRRELTGITEKMLAQQLDELERDQIVKRVMYPVMPPKVEYSLSDFGKTLEPIIEAIADWGTQNNETIVEILESQAK
jgi:DNA-binding HxlR family transcriptional regulator